MEKRHAQAAASFDGAGGGDFQLGFAGRMRDGDDVLGMGREVEDVGQALSVGQMAVDEVERDFEEAFGTFKLVRDN
jgi:hypothetical protein